MKSAMSKFFFILISMHILISGCRKDEPLNSNFPVINFPDEKSLSWDYPVKPGSEKWKTFQSGDEMIMACQIPKNILYSLPAEELLLICMNYPLLFDIAAFNFFSDGYAAYENHFNGIREFYQRSDAHSVIYNYYRQIKLENASVYSTIFFVHKVSVAEYILSASPVISKYSANQRKELALELLSKLNTKKSQPGDFPVNYQNSTYRALFRIIRCNQASELSADDARIAAYFTGVGAAPDSILKQVDNIINSYFSGS